MKKLLLAAVLFASTLVSAETITVLNPQGPGYSGTPQFLATITEANKIQNKYKFVPEFKVGGFESIALLDVKSNPQTKISSVVTSHLEARDRGLIKLEDYVPVFANGDACWALATNVNSKHNDADALKDLNEIVVGAPALGGALHLMGLELGKKYQKPLRFVFYKTNGEAVLAMMQGDVNLTLDRVSVYQSYREKFPNIKLIAMTCGSRHPTAPGLKTLREQGIDVPPIFNVIMASAEMSTDKVNFIRETFEQATKNLGQDQLMLLGDHIPAVFTNIDSATYYRTMVRRHENLRQKWRVEVNAAR